MKMTCVRKMRWVQKKGCKWWLPSNGWRKHWKDFQKFLHSLPSYHHSHPSCADAFDAISSFVEKKEGVRARRTWISPVLFPCCCCRLMNHKEPFRKMLYQVSIWQKIRGSSRACERGIHAWDDLFSDLPANPHPVPQCSLQWKQAHKIYELASFTTFNKAHELHFWLKIHSSLIAFLYNDSPGHCCLFQHGRWWVICMRPQMLKHPQVKGT